MLFKHHKALTALLLSTLILIWQTGNSASESADENTTGESAAAIQIGVDECSGEVKLVTSDALLSEVMQALATELNFELDFRSDNDRPISTDLYRSPRELIETLGKNDNIMMMGEPIDRCGQEGEQLTAVWFLGAGPEVKYRRVKTRGIDELPVSGEDIVNADGSNANPDRKRREKDKSPEEKYYERLERRANSDWQRLAPAAQ